MMHCATADSWPLWPVVGRRIELRIVLQLGQSSALSARHFELPGFCRLLCAVLFTRLGKLLLLVVEICNI